jgi:hypothetical protein
MILRASLLVVTFFVSTPAFAAGGPHPALLLAAPAVRAEARDMTLIATAAPDAKENRNGSAVLVRVDVGKDGGLPACWLLELLGRPATPGKITASFKLSVCPGGPTKGSTLARVHLGGKRWAWRARIEAVRADTHAKGLETRVLWALAADLGEGQGTKLVLERTSTTFKSQKDPAVNQMEQCQAPEVVQGGGDDPNEWPALVMACETETMLGTLPKRESATVRYVWMGAVYQPM